MSLADGLQAVVLAGGKGTRLLPYTAVLPKPLMPLGDKPVLEWLLLHLRDHGIFRVALAVNHLRHLIQSFFGDGRTLGMQISYLIEDQPLGTSGPLAAALDHAESDLLAINGDLVTELDLSAFLRDHRGRKCDLSVATALRSNQLDYGVLEVGDDGRLLSWEEKPVSTHLASLGLYALRRDAVRDLLPKGQRQDMPQLVLRMIEAGRLVSTWSSDALWLDIGRPDDYAKAQDLAQSGATAFFRVRDGNGSSTHRP